MRPAEAGGSAAWPAPAPQYGAAGWAELGFFLLFPGFFAYQTLLGLGLIRAYLGGYFAVISLALLAPLLLGYWRQLRARRLHLHRSEAAFLAFLAYFAVVVACNAANADAAITAHHVLGILYLLNLFIIFTLLDCTGRRFRAVQLGCVLAMSATVYAYAVDGAFYLAALGAAQDPDSVASYQGFSRSYLLPLAVLLACTGAAPLRWLLYALGLATLYLNAARSEFGALLFLMPLIELHAARHRLAALAACALAAVLAAHYLAALLAAIPGNRTLELLDLAHSTSAGMRHVLTERALASIAAHPLLGEYGSYATGLYAHNLLSAWVDLGLFGIAALLALLLLPMLQLAWHGYFAGGPGSRDSALLLAWSLLAMTFMLLCLSHFFSDMQIGAALGAYVRYRDGARHA